MNIDDYEKELLELEEKGLIKARKPDPEEKRALMEAAKNTLQKDRQVSIRLSSRDLVSLKRKANRYGIPYQTFISSVLHRYASGDIHLEEAAGDDAVR
jgi:predicted DNA binding CopG/RHH family protein